MNRAGTGLASREVVGEEEDQALAIPTASLHPGLENKCKSEPKTGEDVPPDIVGVVRAIVPLVRTLDGNAVVFLISIWTDFD